MVPVYPSLREGNDCLDHYLEGGFKLYDNIFNVHTQLAFDLKSLSYPPASHCPDI